MDAAKVSAAISEFARQHRTVLTDLGNRQTQLLEIGATVAVVQHYRANGYLTTIQNPSGVSEFKVKLGTRGHPADYSRVLCSKGTVSCEIHSNLSVESGRRDHGVYCVDVAVVAEGVVPTKKGKNKPPALENQHLISFAEVKKLVVYPMLLAHFIGIVHEVTPQFMKKSRQINVSDNHLLPSLITLGHLTENAKTIKESFERRGYKVCIAESFDLRLYYSRKADKQSPFLPLVDLRAKAHDLDKDVFEDEADEKWDLLPIEDDELDELIRR